MTHLLVSPAVPRTAGFLIAALWFGALALPGEAQIRDGGIDPWNLGKGDWVYYMSMATNKLGGNVSAVTNENSLMLWYKNQGIRYMIVKAATSDYLFNGSYSVPQFNARLVNIAHNHGIMIFGYNRSYGENVPGEIGIADYVFQQGADGFVFDAEAEWESDQPWIGDQGPAKAWELCSAVRSNWPTKFLAHAPFPIISYHSSFPYKEFGFWCDAVMPQIYPHNWRDVRSRPSGGINWTDVNWYNWQNSLRDLPPAIINGITVYWTNAIKPLAPANHVYGPNPPNSGVAHIPDEFVMEFVDYLCADPHAQTPGGYRGANFWRTDLHGSAQWKNIKASTIGTFPGVVGNVVIDDPSAATTGTWTATRTFYNGKFYGDGSGMDTNSFGTNYLTAPRGTGGAKVTFTGVIPVSGDYDIFQWHPTLAHLSASVPHHIVHAGGTTIVYANQQTNAGRWSLLGRFYFQEGAAANVIVADNVAEAGSTAVADGIKFVFVPPASLPAAPTGLIATTLSPSEIALSWRDNATNESGVIVARATTLSGPYIDRTTLRANTQTWTDSGLPERTTFYYVVRAVNFLGASTNSNPASAMTLPLVPEPPAITRHPQGVAVLRGQSATFFVQTDGTPPFAYQWRRNGETLTGATTSNLVIPAVQAADVGSYCVVVSNAYGTAISSTAALAVVQVGVFGDSSFGQGNVTPPATNLVAIAAGAWHCLGLRADGRIVSWGNNWNGQCQVPGGADAALAIAAGGYHSLAICPDQSLVAWGANDSGQCSVPRGIARAIAIAAGTTHSLALGEDGRIIAWGDDTWGQCAVPPGVSNIVAIAAGGNHSLALREDGRVVAWGENTDAQGAFVGQSIVPPHLTNVARIAAGEYHSVVATHDGRLFAWGDNSQHQCAVPANITNVVAVAAGGGHSLALQADGAVAAWGAAWNGQCDLPPLPDAVAVSAGNYHTMVLYRDGTPAARLLNPVVNQGQFKCLIQTLNRSTYRLQRTDSLQAPGWVLLKSIDGNGALRLLSDESAAGPQLFYRLGQ